MGDDYDFGSSSAEHRALFGGQSDAAALMESSNDLILQATRDTLEIEEVASRVMQDLVEQRSAMERFKVLFALIAKWGFLIHSSRTALLTLMRALTRQES